MPILVLHQAVPPTFYNKIVPMTAATCCSSHVQENMLLSIRFTSIQDKTITWLSEFRVSF